MKLKLIAAAVALLASGSSFAAISGPNDGVNGFDSVPTEMFLSVWQQSGTGAGTVNRSFTFDTGVSVADMQANKGVNLFINQVISGSPDWANFLAAGTSTSFQYNVSGGDKIDVARNVLLQTYAASTIAVKNNGVLNDALDSMQLYVGANNATGTHGTAASGNGVSFNTAGDEYFMANGSNNWHGNTGVNSVAVGTAAMFGEMKQSDFFPGNNTTNTIYAGKMLLSQAGGTYSLQYLVPEAPVAAVPEASTYAMLLGGLGAIGFMARRRKSV